MEKWNCNNGCDFVGYPGDFIQMSSPEGTHLMLVCPDCVYDPDLSDWEVDFADDPRGFDTMKALGELRITF